MFSKDEHDEILNEHARLVELKDSLRELGLKIDMKYGKSHAISGADGRVRLSRASGTAQTYAVVFKRAVPSELASALHPHTSLPTLVVAGSITERAASVLRERGINYIDEAGNAYIAWDDVLIDIRGRKTGGRTGASSHRGSKAFSRAGLQVGFVLLSWPDIAGKPLRRLASASGVSLGTAQAVVDDLTKAGYLYEMAGERRLGRAGELLNRWSEAYSTRLSPTLSLGEFEVPDISWWRDAKEELAHFDVQIGGEAGASLLDRHLIPATLTLYADELPRSIIGKRRMARAQQDGNIHIRRRFWTMTEPSRIVPSTLIYADLLASGDPRQREHADRIRIHDDRLASLDRL
ncbi:type IV toxin-antitoxin system AbiEi family antitoxin [Umezawaea sp. Da 62-37]|uniref:type IV toxin-antitoxin system AbiEi family antitoxin n=1 Tax=Umezawaea sp. Da 62-37 TaxID=3075927 RepID=UPI0028F70134|nr:type IV toxin-antitoxin system AbiEi family antitoxin [Umezawaea sp. Da 62-37]WNV82876.1 type IV toxin-antitoxin system AbiEi family antitoxin [Umezawaea sp. Da 62-37]